MQIKRNGIPVNFCLLRVGIGFGKLSQKQAFPRGTSAKPSHGAARQTLQQSASVAAASATVTAGSGAADVGVQAPSICSFY